MHQKELPYKLVAVLAFLIAAVFSVGYHHFDEHFQIIEFAAFKLGKNSIDAMPWEYHQRIRPTLQPAMLVGFQRFLSWFTVKDPFVIATLLRLISGTFAFYLTNLMYRSYKKSISDPVILKWFLILTYTLWFSFYIGVRFSSENWSALTFMLAFCLYLLKEERSLRDYLLIGVLFGFSFIFRFQAALMIIGFSLWMLIIAKEKFKKLLMIILGFTLIFFLGVLVDRWFYGEWTLSSYNYIAEFVGDQVSRFGDRPWYWYFTKVFESTVPPISLLILLSYLILVFLRPKSAVVWVTLPFILVHILIGHKELRFLFPLYLFVPIIIVKGMISVQKLFTLKLSSNTAMRWVMKLVFVVNFILLIVVIFKPADNQIGLYQTIYRNYHKPITLYYLDRNPYHRVLPINYYKRNQLAIYQVNDIEEIPRDTTTKLVVLEHRLKKDQLKNARLVYSSFPQWLLEYNFNNWQDRTSAWYVYEF
jgi:phosphatidylinositol glycan class B